MGDNLGAALDLLRRGLAVVPFWPIDQSGCCTCQKGGRCNGAGRHPKFYKGQYMSTPDSVTAHWQQHPNDPPGFDRAGSSVVTVDDDGEAAEWLAATGIELPDTFTLSTPNSRPHAEYRLEPGTPALNVIKPTADGRTYAVDILAAGRSPGPGCRRPGRTDPYRVANDAPLAAAPAALVDLLTKEAAKRAETSGEAVPPEPPPDPLPAPVQALLDRPLSDWPVAVSHDGIGRSEATYAVVAACFETGLSHGQAVTVLEDFEPAVDKFERPGDSVADQVAACWGRLAKAAGPEPAWLVEGRAPTVLEACTSEGTPRWRALAGQYGPDPGAVSTPEPSDSSDGSGWLGGRVTDPGVSESLPLFGVKGGLLVANVASTIDARHPAALTAENQVALYRDGAYRLDTMALRAALAKLLGNRFRPEHVNTVGAYLAAALYDLGRVLPTHADRPLLNVANGMLDLTTGELLAYDPAYLSSVQLPVAWEPEATCPCYEAWLAEQVPDQADDLEETVAGMLDPSRTPSKSLFAYGPARSGKSTFLRLAAALAGPGNYSAVTLHELADNRFRAASLYGKILNSAADLSAAHVEDISLFKRLTGEDPVEAERKYVQAFTFTNTALFAFSANELPTVGESSRAYIERIKPFKFGRSFAGREDPGVEAAMMAELPGILVRWVRAWQRRNERGRALPTTPAVQHDFETRSDRVRQFVALRCTPTGSPAVSEATEQPAADVTAGRAFAQQFNQWAIAQGAPTIGERKILDRLTSIDGVVRCRREGTGARVWSVRVHPLSADDNDPYEPHQDRPAVPAVPPSPPGSDRERERKREGERVGGNSRNSRRSGGPDPTTLTPAQRALQAELARPDVVDNDNHVQ